MGSETGTSVESWSGTNWNALYGRVSVPAPSLIYERPGDTEAAGRSAIVDNFWRLERRKL
jgi:hypothetical protein